MGGNGCPLSKVREARQFSLSKEFLTHILQSI